MPMPRPPHRPLHPLGFAFPMDELRDELDRLWTSLTAAPPLHGWGVRSGSELFPAVNVSESDDCITIEAELPGLDVADIDIAVSGEELVLKGSRPEGSRPETPLPIGQSPATPLPASEAGRPEPKGVVWHRRERGTGSFERRLTLPMAVDAGRVEATLVDGVLTITCPKAADRKPHKVAVRTG